MAEPQARPTGDVAVSFADLLDELLSTLARAARGGDNRLSSAQRAESLPERLQLLTIEVKAATAAEDGKQRRNAARRKQQKKKRTMERKL